ncbi:MAG TPA: response regulator, partial [Candidatus Methylomirabilis sp.]|nr:response regulator [Candidatus Methylomirabilis sp.]
MAVVLIVAEDEQMRRDIGRTLRETGHSPIFAHDAHSAFQELANRPDLVLLDLDLPDLEGEEALRDFERQLEMAQLPALVLVGQRQAATRLHASGIGGVMDILVKPVSAAQLRQAAARALTTIHQPLDPEALRELRERQRALIFRLINDGSDALAFHV